MRRRPGSHSATVAVAAVCGIWPGLIPGGVTAAVSLKTATCRMGNRGSASAAGAWASGTFTAAGSTRAQDSAEVVARRMAKAADEMSHWAEYDYIVVNHNVDDAFAEVQSILKAERLKRERRTGLTEFVRKLQRQLEK